MVLQPVEYTLEEILFQFPSVNIMNYMVPFLAIRDRRCEELLGDRIVDRVRVTVFFSSDGHRLK